VRVDRALGVRTRAGRARAHFLFLGASYARRTARILATALMAATGLIVGVLPLTAAHADTGIPMVAMVNQARAIEGLPPLADNPALAAVAQAQAVRMASAGILKHNPNLATDICCWTGLGENVGYGGSIAILDSAFLASPEHRANMMGHYNQIGIGVVTDSHGLVWVSEVYRLTAGASSTAVVTASTRPVAARTTAVITPLIAAPVVKPAAARPVQVVATPSRRLGDPTTSAPKTVTKTRGPSKVTTLATVPARTVTGDASRSMTTGRQPLALAATANVWSTRWLAMIGSAAYTAVGGVDPVATVLSFAAQTAASAADTGSS
jgi:hypothetical protein